MANDRIFIVCSYCGGWKMLLSHFPGSLSTRDNNILDWINAHAKCHKYFFSSDLHGETGFCLITEDNEYMEMIDMKKQNYIPSTEERELIRESYVTTD